MRKRRSVRGASLGTTPPSNRLTASTNPEPTAAPTDPGLEAFLREVGYMAADAVLKNYREGRELAPVSIKSPRGTHRNRHASEEDQKA